MLYIVVGALIIGVIVMTSQTLNGHVMNDNKLLDIYFNIARLHISNGVDSKLIASIIAVESAGNPNAVSSCNAIGLMQITPIVVEEYNNVTLSQKEHIECYEPAININIGSWYLQRLINHYGFNLYDALRAYNGGLGNVRKSKSQSVDYANKVMYYNGRLETFLKGVV